VTEPTGPGSPAAVVWHAGSATDRLTQLDSGPRGLSDERARERLAEVGPNEIPRQSVDGPLRILWRQVAQPLIYVLLGAAALSALAGEIVDAAVIFGVVVINALIGFVQEFRAGREMQALAALAGDQSTVIRDGEPRLIDARDLVPGDLLTLEPGEDETTRPLSSEAARPCRLRRGAPRSPTPGACSHGLRPQSRLRQRVRPACSVGHR
jgi:hypothetical protein